MSTFEFSELLFEWTFEFGAGTTYRTMVANVCANVPARSDEGCAACKTQSDCPRNTILTGSQTCLGNTTSDTRSCMICPNSCTLGTFLTSDCAVDKIQKCSPCKTTCNVHEYRSQACTIWQDTQCAACNSSRMCPRFGMFVNQSCTGRETRDVSACANCSSAVCAPNFFANVSACLVSRSVDATTLCRPCSPKNSCGDGYFEAAPCNASSDRVCMPCTRCSATQNGVGDFQVAPCNQTADAKCQSCRSCAPIGVEWKSQVCSNDYERSKFQVRLCIWLNVFIQFANV